MKILISNDDGVQSPGIHALAEAAKVHGEVTVVAPHRERSTAGHSLTLHKPLHIHTSKEHPEYFAVTGTPADCIYMGTRHILKEKPDLIISGINRGANLAADTYYSGTVAAAREGVLAGIRSVAISLCIFPHKDPDSTHHWETAANFIKNFIPVLNQSDFPASHIINVNVPNLPQDKIKGVKLSRMGRRYYHESILERKDPRGKTYYWIGGPYKDFDPIPESDCIHVDQGFISVTPLQIDKTDYELFAKYKDWETAF